MVRYDISPMRATVHTLCTLSHYLFLNFSHPKILLRHCYTIFIAPVTCTVKPPWSSSWRCKRKPQCRLPTMSGKGKRLRSLPMPELSQYCSFWEPVLLINLLLLRSEIVPTWCLLYRFVASLLNRCHPTSRPKILNHILIAIVAETML